MLRSADITMYRAKAAGGNRYELADAEADARAITRHGLTTALPAALERGEFFIEYQPLVHLGDGTVHGAEALVRWSHPQHGILGPDRFIPLAEHTGLIVPLGRWVLEQSVRQARDWQCRTRRPARPPRINVNLSPIQLHHPGLVDDTVDGPGPRPASPPGSLCLEVTEIGLIGADEDLLKPLRRLAEMGVDIALDDFGTGYSNLSSLRRLPVSVLKLDRSFTQGMQQHPADPVDLKIVEGIVSLAHSLDLTVTVEGVETRAQAEHLRRAGLRHRPGLVLRPAGPARAASHAVAGRRRLNRRPYRYRRPYRSARRAWIRTAGARAIRSRGSLRPSRPWCSPAAGPAGASTRRQQHLLQFAGRARRRHIAAVRERDRAAQPGRGQGVTRSSRPGACADHAGHDRHAQAGPDEPEHRVHLAALDREGRLEPRRPAGRERQVAQVVAVPEHHHRLAPQIGDPHRARAAARARRRRRRPGPPGAARPW